MNCNTDERFWCCFPDFFPQNKVLVKLLGSREHIIFHNICKICIIFFSGSLFWRNKASSSFQRAQLPKSIWQVYLLLCIFEHLIPHNPLYLSTYFIEVRDIYPLLMSMQPLSTPVVWFSGIIDIVSSRFSFYTSWAAEPKSERNPHRRPSSQCLPSAQGVTNWSVGGTGVGEKGGG